MIAQVSRRRDGAAVFCVPYRRRWVETVKAEVPGWARQWDPAAKAWTILPPYVARVLALTRATFTDVADASGPDQGSPSANATHGVNRLYGALHLLPTAPPAVVEAAYRALAREHHPDRQPQAQQVEAHECMVEINAAFAALRDRRPS